MSTTSVQRNDADVPRVGGERGQNEPGAKTPATGGTITAEPARTPAVEAPPPSPTLPEKDPSRYRLIGEHGRGGIGRVLTAFDEELERSVAVKELHHVNQASEARFIREAKITARLEHPSIVPVHEAGRWPDGTPFYAMKLIAGRSLKQLIEQAESFEDRLKLLPNVLAVAEAIAYAHSEGVIHRDLKPSNVIVGDYGETVVIDWGLAKDLRATDDDAPHAGPYRTREEGAELTQAGEILGTPAYMPPEQARGEEVDERADVYALGAMLYHVLAGRPPFGGATSADVLRNVLAKQPSPIRTLAPVPDELAAVVAKAMATRAQERYQSARDLADDLRRFLTGKLVAAYSYGPAAIVRHWVARHKGISVTIAAALFASASVGTYSIRKVLIARDAAQAAERTAHEERRAALESRDAMILAHAQAYLDTDPTETLRWLKEYLKSGTDLATARQLAGDAVARGVALEIGSYSDEAIWDTAFSDDERFLAFGGVEDVVFLRDLELGETSELPGYAGVRKLAFMPSSGNDLRVVAGGAGNMQMFDFKSHRVHTLFPNSQRTIPDIVPSLGLAAAQTKAHQITVWSASSNTATLLTTSFEENNVFQIHLLTERLLGVASVNGFDGELHDIKTGNRILLTGHTASIGDMAYSTRFRLILTGGMDGTVRTWGAHDGRLLGTVEADPKGVAEMDISPDGSLVAAAGYSGSITVWEIDSAGMLHLVAKQTEPTTTVSAVRFLSDGQQVVAADYAGDVWFLHLDSGRLERRRGHQAKIRSIAIAPKSQLVATVDERGEFRLWKWPDSGNSQVIREFPVDVTAVATLGDRQTVFIGTHHGDLHMWSAGNPGATASGRAQGRVLRLIPTTSGSEVVAWTQNGLYAWTPETNAVVPKGPDQARPRPWLVLPTANDDELITATHDADGDVFTWNVQSDAWNHELSVGTPVRNVRKLGTTLLVATESQEVLAFTKSGKGYQRSVLAKHSNVVTSLDVDEPSHAWASGGWDGLVHYSVGEKHASSLKFENPIRKVLYEAGGRRLFIGDNSGAVYSVDTTSGARAQLCGLEGAATSLTVSADGRFLVTASNSSGRLLVVDLASGSTVSLRGHRGGVESVASDDDFIYTAGADGVVRRWRTANLDFPPTSRSGLLNWINQHTTVPSLETHLETEKNK